MDKVREGKGVERREERARGRNSEGAKIATELIHSPQIHPPEVSESSLIHMLASPGDGHLSWC